MAGPVQRDDLGRGGSPLHARDQPRQRPLGIEAPHPEKPQQVVVRRGVGDEGVALSSTVDQH